MRPSERYRRRRDTVAEFIDRYRRLADLYTQERDAGEPGSLDEEVRQTRQEVAAAAGAASVATSRFHGTFRIKPPGTMTDTLTLDPIASWSQPFAFGNVILSAEDVLEWALQCHGALAADAERAQARERGLVGLLARFLRFPADVREAAGVSSQAGQRAVFGVAAALQTIITGTIIGLAVALIVRALGADSLAGAAL